MSEKRTMWCTKWCLTRGIIRYEDCEPGSDSTGKYWYYKPEGRLYTQLVVGQSGFFTEEEAIADAEKKRAAKIKNLKAQIKKLERLLF